MKKLKTLYAVLLLVIVVFSCMVSAIAESDVMPVEYDELMTVGEQTGDVSEAVTEGSTTEGAIPNSIPEDIMKDVEISPTVPDGMDPDGNYVEGVSPVMPTVDPIDTIPQTESEVPQTESQVPEEITEAPVPQIGTDQLQPEIPIGDEDYGEVSITKYVYGDTGYRLEQGVRYIFHREGVAEDEPRTGMTDEKGHFDISLPTGSYQVEEEGIDATVKADVFTIHVEKDGKQFIRIVDDEVQSNLLVLVRDALTGEPLEGVTLEFYREDLKVNFADPMAIESTESLTTDKEGYIHLFPSANSTDFSVMEGDIGYKVVSTPAGYEISDSIIPVHVQASDVVKGQYTLDIALGYAKGSVEISAKDKASEAQLAGVVFLLAAAEDIRIAENNLAYSKGETVSEIVTNENGLAVIENLPEGHYQVFLKQRLDGYVFDQEAKMVNITREEKALRVSFELVPTMISINVTNEVNGDVAGIRFQYGMQGQQTKIAETDGNGHALISKLTPGTWTLKMSNTKEGTEQDTNEYTFVVDENGYINGKIAEYINITLKKKAQSGAIVANSKLTISIIDAEDESFILGSAFEVLGENGQVITNGIMRSGPVVIEDLPAGRYIVRQTVASKGYVISKEEYPVELNIDRTVTITNDRVYGYIEINKLTSTKMEGIAGAKFIVSDVSKKELEVVTTGKDGKAITNKYPIGVYADGVMTPVTYYISEKSPASGFQEDGKVYEVAFDYLDSETPLVYIRIKIPGFAKVQNTVYTTNGQADALSSSGISNGTAAGKAGNPEGVSAGKTGLTNRLPLLLAGFCVMAVCGIGLLVIHFIKKRR